MTYSLTIGMAVDIGASNVYRYYYSDTSEARMGRKNPGTFTAAELRDMVARMQAAAMQMKSTAERMEMLGIGQS